MECHASWHSAAGRCPPTVSREAGWQGMAKRRGTAAEGRAFGEDVLEALLWEAVEDVLLTLPGGAAGEWARGLDAWGRDLLARWPQEVAGFLEAFREDEDAGRLERLRDGLQEVPSRRPPGMRLLSAAMAG